MDFAYFRRRRASTLVLLTILATFVSLASLTPTRAQAPYEPARGSSERSAVLDAVRPLAEARLNPPVEFVVDWMRVSGGWAFVSLAPQRPGGGKIDLRQTTYAQQAEYMDGAQIYALLSYANNRWNIIDFAVGPTDVFWSGDPLYLRLPRGMVPN